MLIIAILVFLIKKKKKQKPLTPLAELAFAFVIAGIIFRDGRLAEYSLIGIGVLLAVIDIIKKSEKKYLAKI